MTAERDQTHFIACLKAIQRHYVHLPKIARLRVEAWVEKIAAGGATGNISFALHRYRYAKLLMHQCMKREISEPFDKPPPDGLLPAFPTHLRSKLRGVVDPQEATFWSHIFDTLQQSGNVPSRQHDDGDEERDGSRQIVQVDCSAEVIHKGAEQMRKLQEVIQTQEHRIALLVKQMESDRAAFQLSLQRQEHEYKSQLARLEHTLKEISRMSVKRTPISRANALGDEEESLLLAPLPTSRSNDRYVDPPNAEASTPNITSNMSDEEFMQYLSQFQRELRTDGIDLLF